MSNGINSSEIDPLLTSSSTSSNMQDLSWGSRLSLHLRNIGSRRTPKQCDTCQGTGYLPDGDQSELVALIPQGDSRLKPSHTKLYASAAVLFCLVAGSIITFFLFPRQTGVRFVVTPLLFNATSDSSMLVSLQLDFNVTNLNYFPLEVTRTHVFVAVSTVVAGSVQYNNSFSVAARSMSQVKKEMTVTIYNRQFVDSCTIQRYGEIFLNIKVEMDTSFMSSASQMTSSYYNFFVCRESAEAGMDTDAME